jgi:hypothetical protein
MFVFRQKRPDMPRTLLKCYLCGENLPRDQLAVSPKFEVCRDCLEDAVLCPQCDRFRPSAEMRGSYCKPCRSDYYREWRQGRAR